MEQRTRTHRPAAPAGSSTPHERVGSGARGSVLESIGNTPLIKFTRVTADLRPGATLLAKAQWMNPGGSVKDRPALSMILDGERRGILSPTTTILDASSGNAAVAYAMIGSARPVLLAGSMTLVLPPALLEQICRHGEETYPHECCGFLFGSQEDGVRRIAEIRRQPNERTESRNNRFLITPRQFRNAERAARAAGLLMVGIYHSHPDSPARPSEYDRDHAWPWYSYLIVSVGRGSAGESRVWELREDRTGFVTQVLEIGPGAAERAPGSQERNEP
jgi:proteasome lid subunit RPN8/RPN11